MKFLIAFAALVAVAYATSEDAAAVVEKSVSDSNPDGSYHNALSLSNGIQQEEAGELKQVQDEEGKAVQALVSHGQYSYTAPDGQKVLLTWTADEAGFHPVGDHLPVAPVPV